MTPPPGQPLRLHATVDDLRALERRVDGLEDIVPRLGSLMAEMGKCRQEASGAKAIAQKCFERLEGLERSVDQINDWKEDTKVTAIKALRGENAALKHEKYEAQKEAEKERARDKLDFRRSMRAAIFSAIGTGLVGALTYLLSHWR